MTKFLCCRHLRALTKKNFIIWKRTACCSALEILTPILLMVVLWVIRVQIPTANVDRDSLLNKKFPMALGVGQSSPGTWAKEQHPYEHWINDKVSPMYEWANYTGPRNNVDPYNYNVLLDKSTFSWFTPGHCMQRFDFNRPKKMAPQIAIIGAQSNITDSVAQYMQAIKSQNKESALKLVVPAYTTTYYNSTEEFDAYIASPDYKSDRKHTGVCFGVQHYVDDDTAANNFTFSLHFPDQSTRAKLVNGQAIPNQQNAVWLPFTAAPNIQAAVRYQHNGFSFIQNMIANKILMNEKDDWNAWISYLLQPIPTDVTVTDPFQQGLAILLPLFLLLAYIPPVYNMTFKVVREKETRAKETMRIMGMTDLPYWMSWFVFYTLINTIVSTLAWMILLPAVINYSQPFYLWIFFWLYGEAVFGQIIFLQSMFTGSKYAGIVSTIIYFCGVLVNKAIMNDDVTRMQKLFASLLPQVALMQGSAVFANYEGTGVGLNASTVAVTYNEYSFNTAIAMLLLDFFIFFLLGLYMDKVIPSDFGQRLSPCFLCMPSYYKCCRSQNRGNQDGSRVNLLEGQQTDDTFESNEIPEGNYESPAVICKRMEATGDYLKIQDLQKTFSGGFQAVRGVNVKMYNSQIFALLGHNGAGKTTVISMLTGLLNKTQGGARCFDVDMFERMDEVREFMGVCPQHDVLFDQLTPREHLDIFYDFKGGDPKRKKQEIDSLIADVGLTIDQRKLAKTLSGGNKRKLSVSIALCGGSKLVLLDEPTSGMDLGARRNLWDMLKSYKKDRIIILTTHYMDEADVLGDRIGIMCKGKLQCIGSSLFLKNRFGVGYKLTFVKKNTKVHPGLAQYLQSYFQGVQMTGDLHAEISFVIPKNESQSFASFFENLDQRLDEFEIRSYGVSMSNLEDVFLKINQEYAPDLFGDLKGFGARKSMLQAADNSNLAQPIGYSQEADSVATLSQKALIGNALAEGLTASESNSQNLSSDEEDQYEIDDDEGQNLIRGSSCVRSCTASSAKRIIIYKRDWCGLLCQIVIPITLVLFGLWLQAGPTKLHQSPPRPLSTGFYPYKQRVLMNNNPVNMTGDGFDVASAELAAALPNATTAFDVKFIGDSMNYTQFYDAVYEYRNDLPLFPYRYGSYQVYQANRKSNQYNIVNVLNATSQDVTAMFPQYMYQAILRVATEDPEFTFNVINQPFPIYQKYIDIEKAAGAYDFVFMTAIALALIPCVMVQFILNERELQLKHQQLLSGMSLPGYWASNLVFDIFMAYIPIALIILLMNVFNVSYDGAWVLLMLYPPAIVPFTYVTSFLFKSDINAQIVTLFLHFISGGLFVVLVYVLQYIPASMHVGDPLRWVCCIFPSFCVTHGILFSASGTLLISSRVEDTTDEGVIIPRKIPSEIWAWYNLKGDAVILVCHFFLGILLLMLVELEIWQYFRWCPKSGFRFNSSWNQGPEMIKDDDVISEEKRVARQDGERQSFIKSHNSVTEGDNDREQSHVDCIRVHNFQKEYDTGCGMPVKAVRQASFGLDYGECFALLGVNGAGKSTTFKSLTREIAPTSGQITVQGFDVQKQFQEARKLIGYCPQYDAIFHMLSVEETLKFYALIKGIRTTKIKGVVEKAIKDLNLKDHRNKLAGTLSGGNKRKLSVAMALIGNPPIILLDEPSAGMDPEARRFMWQVVEKISQRDKKSAVILTTHSMEEAEALSTKMGIMVRGGVFRCMGSTQHIKNKFGIGYEVEIKVEKPSFHELQQFARQLGFKEEDIQSRVALDEALQQLSGAGFDQMILDQIKENGMGSDLISEAELSGDQGQIRLINLLEFLRSQSYGFSILKFLSRDFSYVEILEQCGEFFKMRVPKEDKTIGWLFGQLEHQKGQLGIQEYSISQTTLEQIFQSFANQSIASDKAALTFHNEGDRLVLQNPDHEMTQYEECLSQRGLSFNRQNDDNDQDGNSGGRDGNQDENGKQLLLPRDC